jgi:hypothetical protein
MEGFKSLINYISNPTILVTAVIVGFPFIFPPSNWFYRIHKKLGLDKLWTMKGLIVMTSVTIAFFIFGLGDDNFKKIVLKPDNVPISGLIILLIFFTWLSMHQAYKNDKLIDQGKPVDEHYEAPNDKVLVWPDLVYVELISLILFSAFMLIWSIGLPAPLEQPANPSESPNPAKAPWYFLGLQEMLVYFDPWYAGVVLPTFIIIGLMAIPYIDSDPNGSGYFSYKNRMLSVSIYLFGWLVLWNVLIVIGTFLRGPNWGFFGPFEYWDPHRLEALTNVNLSELFYVKWFNTGLPSNILLREAPGLFIVFIIFAVLPPLFAKTLLKSFYDRLGSARYTIFVVLMLFGALLPVKMYLRWFFNLKYIISMPEFFFNF